MLFLLLRGRSVKLCAVNSHSLERVAERDTKLPPFLPLLSCFCFFSYNHDASFSSVGPTSSWSLQFCFSIHFPFLLSISLSFSSTTGSKDVEWYSAKKTRCSSESSLSLSLCFWRGLLLRKLTKSSSVREHVWWKNKHLQVLENNIFCLLHVDDDVDASSSTCLLPQHTCLLSSLLVLLVLLFLWQFPFSFCILLVGSSCPSAATFWNHSSHIIINKLCDWCESMATTTPPQDSVLHLEW